ncbi:hypothetical protein H5154_11620 [Pseudoalteromonas sp. SR44-5]|uniref:Uncharacterized protein n=1 Tax=Pseudoalteromonas rhizosphaerae TaxID=2518973 RepID=A0ABW8L0L0_9GAMM|nr:MULTISPECIES: hypothetical protein [Pseudoalteromonas]MBB1333735.1 hypothetical protein [Pseudoalteromonas sp. SR41-6]MBB1341792.1 hypothetical protein [Pseudoalteromonas sp. SR45-6]MBB1367025.1 hypothetical protein [Pseudoalteromonas sp. SR44-5]MBB1459457.1 hypothetical protein [Pseudoalteromonas sp. SG41-8]MBB1467599.1 hypothetical protein [Pseudoalteromonas sp. SG41-5]
MFLTEQFGFFSLSALSAWGFLMAFFFNIFIYSIDVKRKTTLLISSFIMMISYMAGDHFFTWLSSTAVTYMHWALYDFVTLLCLAGCYLVIKNSTPSFIYLVCGLSINILLFVSVYLDVQVYENSTYWILWDIYSFGVNIIDFTMIVALIVDRDILGLIRLKNAIKALFKTHHIKHSI